MSCERIYSEVLFSYLIYSKIDMNERGIQLYSFISYIYPIDLIVFDHLIGQDAFIVLIQSQKGNIYQFKVVEPEASNYTCVQCSHHRGGKGCG